MGRLAHMMLRVFGVSLLLVGVAAGIPACSRPPDTTSEDSVEGPVGPAPPVLPPAPDLTTPENAVRSYLDWVSLAYRMANSAVASQTLTPFEEVRVDSYIQLNLQAGRAIEQALTDVDIRHVDASEPTATVATSETWAYRYFSVDTMRYEGPEHTASYDVTYTVVLQPDGRWLVDDVEALALTPVE